MGCCHSARVFVANPSVAGQGEAVLEVFKVLGLSTSEVNVMFSIFSEIDTQKTGSIRPVELYSYFNIETGELEKNLFMVFDEGNTGKLNFAEFVVAMWNFLSLPERLVAAVVYLMKDPTGTFCINLQQVRELFEIIHHRKVETSPVLSQLFHDFKHRFSLEVSIHDFCSWVNANASFLTPVVILQIKLRKHVIGEGFWQRRAKAREEHATQGHAAYVHQLHGIVRRVNDDYYQRMQEAQRKEKQAGVSDEERVAVQRQNSVFRKAFQLSSKSAGVGKKSQTSLPSGRTAGEDSTSGPRREGSPSAAAAGRPRKKSNAGGAGREDRTRPARAKPAGQNSPRRG